MKFLILFSSIVAINGRYVDRNNFDNDINILNKCVDGIQEFTDCVKFKTIKLLDRIIINRNPIPLANFLYLTHENSAKNLTESNLFEDEESLIGNNVDDDKLTDVLMKRVRQLTSTKNLQIKFDTNVEQFEGRKKNKNKGGQVMMMMGAGAMMLHAIMSKIAFIAGKALIIAKIALVLSAVIALKKLSSQNDHQESTQVIYKQAESGHGGGGWHRSIDTPDTAVHAHQLAYNGQIHDT